ncbi:N/A [soil metagenome]
MISIVIVNFRQNELLIKCVRSIYEKIRSYPFEVIIVNNSPDEDISFLETDFAELKILKNDNNGLAIGRNTGVKVSKFDHILFLDPDTEMRTDPFSILIPEFIKTKFGAVGLKMYSTNNIFQLSFGKLPDPEGNSSNRSDEKKFHDMNLDFILEKEYEYGYVRFVEYINSTAVFMKKSVFESIGGYNERFFLYYEDADLCQRLKRKNLPVFFFPFLKLVHFNESKKELQSFKYFHKNRSKLVYNSLWLSSYENFIYRLYFILKYLFLSFAGFKVVYFKILKLAFLPVSKF